MSTVIQSWSHTVIQSTYIYKLYLNCFKVGSTFSKDSPTPITDVLTPIQDSSTAMKKQFNYYSGEFNDY